MTLWITKELIDILNKQTEHHLPNETGGILMGFISSRDYVITRIIGPGPNAVHKTYKFIPDHEYQSEKIIRHFNASSGVETYLGDWHSHPNTSAYLSLQDKITLESIALFEDAHIINPIMMVLGTEPKEIKCWRYVRKNKVELQKIKIYN